MSDLPEPKSSEPPVVPPPATAAYPRSQVTAQKVSGLDAVIPTSNPPSLLAYYLGLFSILPVAGAVMGPVAIFSGVKGLRKVKEINGLPGKTHAWVGIVMGTIGTLFNLLILIVVVVALLNRK